MYWREASVCFWHRSGVLGISPLVCLRNNFLDIFFLLLHLRFIADVGDDSSLPRRRAKTTHRGIQPLRRNLHQHRLKHIDRRMRCRINVFESWLQSEPYSDLRAIEDIPPFELDQYLTDFFLSVKTLSGEEYTHSSLSSIRGSLERYLKESGYGESIVLSPLFAGSQKVWFDKCKQRAKRTAVRKVSPAKKKSI